MCDKKEVGAGHTRGSIRPEHHIPLLRSFTGVTRLLDKYTCKSLDSMWHLQCLIDIWRWHKVRFRLKTAYKYSGSWMTVWNCAWLPPNMKVLLQITASSVFVCSGNNPDSFCCRRARMQICLKYSLYVQKWCSFMHYLCTSHRLNLKYMVLFSHQIRTDSFQRW